MSDDSALSIEFTLHAAEQGIDLADEDELEDLIRFVLAAERATGPWEIAVALISDAALQDLHRDFMGIDEPTDIMTFPYGDELPGGDLAISADHARLRASEWGKSAAEEILFLVAHGVLHLVGWRDGSPEEREMMLERQAALIRDWRNQRSAS